MLSERDAPIIAVATPAGKGAVGMVRISGKNLQAFANALCQQALVPRSAHLVNFRDAHGQAIDQVLALFFPAPHSYTGEDVLELQGHGGPVVLSMLVERCLEFAHKSDLPLLGLRLAQPGEFTQRAYFNQKMDLAQAEAVSKPKPATGGSSPNSAYCLRKLVICVPARLDTTTSGFASRIFSR